MPESAISAMTEKLFPAAQWITPNIPEAELICNRNIQSPDDLAVAALELYNQYGCNVLLKSGHAISSDRVTDIVCYQGRIFALSSPVVNIRKNTAHGTGCTLSAAMAANLALGKSWDQALKEAKAFVFGSLCENKALSENLSQMYPPESNYLNITALEEL